jgi:MFS family permease
VRVSGRLTLLHQVRDFRLLFLAMAGSAFGTYLAAVALTLDVFALTDSGTWVAALLVADFLPIIVIGLALGPLVDRLQRRRLMIAADITRAGVFCALPFVHSAAAVVGLAAVSGIATGFFRPAVYAGVPNLVGDDDDDLTEANSLLTGVENLAWVVGPLVAGAIVAAFGPDPAYWINAVTFAFSALLVTRIPATRLQSAESLSRGHWRDVREGIDLVLGAPALRTVLIVWNVVIVGNAAVNVAEVVFAKNSLSAGSTGFGVLVASSGIGLTLGSFATPLAMGSLGLHRLYVISIALMAAGWGFAAAAPSLWIAAALVVVASFGNGMAIVCNQVLIQRGSPDRLRGRAIAVLMSSTYATMAVAMAVAGVLVNAFGGRVVWALAGTVYVLAALVAAAMTRRLPRSSIGRLPETEPLVEDGSRIVERIRIATSSGHDWTPDAPEERSPAPQHADPDGH